MEGYIDENKWIDLSGLPRLKYGSTTRIDWVNSIGYTIPFKCNGVSNNIKIEDYILIKRTSYVFITIDKYVTIPYQISTTSIVGCKIKHLVTNRIIDVAPHLIKYLVNQDDAYKYNVHSKKYILVKCPICGTTSKKSVYDIYQIGFSCDVCADGISAPNKIMSAVLEQCNVSFIPEVSKKHGFKWMSDYRYDFYLYHNNQHILIEMDGGLHNLEIQKKRDKIKTELANQHKFKLIRIDCDYGSQDVFEYVKQNIEMSELRDILPLDIVDWNYCHKKSFTRLMVEACKLWEEEKLSIKEICARTHLSNATILSYLRRGKDLNLSPSYSISESTRRGNRIGARPVALLKNDKICEIFNSVDDLVSVSKDKFGFQLTKKGIYYACDGHIYHDLHLRLLTREEYEQYKMIINNKEVVKEVTIV